MLASWYVVTTCPVLFCFLCLLVAEQSDDDDDDDSEVRPLKALIWPDAMCGCEIWTVKTTNELHT